MRLLSLKIMCVFKDSVGILEGRRRERERGREKKKREGERARVAADRHGASEEEARLLEGQLKELDYIRRY